ncbi:heme-degrading domain-containing protein [Georgenia thermotolerans]|uniref:Heme-degrading domain-containing protein n=1 Tax=Georgenia thermotolerans TaxID=527326 RepID=A0A7J5UQU8_9MICO|nr:heme-degrading domain-containing protein [Georgenia thermotolerans]KAE8764798.1 heme-degrading domain-containing protein [Georgenia thermotolerans]
MTTATTELYERILADEAEIVFPSFDRQDAWELGCQMRAAALARSLPIVIGIVLGQQQVFRSALDGSSADNDAWLARKTAVVLRYGRSSMGVGELFRVQGRVFERDSRLDPDAFAAHGGVFPVQVAGTGVVGAVGVSGLPQAEDHAFVVGQLREFLAARRR